MLQIFATGSDMRSLLAAIESQRPLRYVLTGASATPAPEFFDSSEDLPNLGLAVVGDQSREPSYLVIDKAEGVEARPVRQRRGGVLYFVDQQLNPRSIVLRPGGVYRQTFIIAGQVGTISANGESQKLIRAFKNDIKKQFSRIKSYYVGHDAALAFDGGMRLTTSTRAPVEYDLKRD